MALQPYPRLKLPILVPVPLPFSQFSHPCLHLKSGIRASRAAATDKDAENVETDNLASDFMHFVVANNMMWPLEMRRPTPLLPPNTVVKIQMDALMRNDWPDQNSGVKVAFDFALPYNVNHILHKRVGKPVTSARFWDANEKYLGVDEFSFQLRNSVYAPIINCSDWKVASPVVFHGPGDRHAVQVVRIEYICKDGYKHSSFYTFCLEKVQKGAYKGCWMTVGMHFGDLTSLSKGSQF